MANPIAIATADHHVKRQTWVSRRALRGDAFFGFSQVIDLALQYEVPVISAGDLLDKVRNDSEVVGFLRRQLLRLGPLPFNFVQGNHDAAPGPWLLSVSDQPQWLDVERNGRRHYELPGGLRLAGLDWRSGDQLPAALDLVDEGADVLVLHQITAELMGDLVQPELTISQIPHASFCVLGDFHEHTTVHGHGRQGQQVDVLSPGSTSLQTIAESPDKRVFIVYDDLSIDTVALKHRPFCRPNVVTTSDDLDAVLARLPTEIENLRQRAVDNELPKELWLPLVDIWFSDSVPSVYRRVSQLVGDSAHLFMKRIPVATVERAEETAEETMRRHEAVAGGLLGCLPLVLTREESPEVFAVTQRLLQAQDLRAELAALRAEHGI